MLARGLVAATQGNVSARAGDALWITPSAQPYEPMTAGDVVRVELDTPPPAGGGVPSSEWRVHVAIYRARPDVTAIVHTHSVHATAWAHLGEDLALGTEDFPDPVRTAARAATGTEALASAATEALGPRRAVLLARHGVVGVGGSLDAALDVCTVVERLAQMAWLLRSGGATAAR
jgi:L-fuculose-phosphate aldolase